MSQALISLKKTWRNEIFLLFYRLNFCYEFQQCYKVRFWILIFIVQNFRIFYQLLYFWRYLLNDEAMHNEAEKMQADEIRQKMFLGANKWFPIFAFRITASVSALKFSIKMNISHFKILLQNRFFFKNVQVE